MRSISVLITAAALSLGALSSRADTIDTGWTLESHIFTADTGADVINFSLTFSKVPDFYTVDEFGRQKNGFLVLVGTQHQTPTGSHTDAEVAIHSKTIPTLDQLLVDDTPVGIDRPDRFLDFTVVDRTVTFQMPFDYASIPSGGPFDGAFTYYIHLVSYGSTTDRLAGPAFVPLPASAWGGGALLAALAGAHGIRRYRAA